MIIMQPTNQTFFKSSNSRLVKAFFIIVNSIMLNWSPHQGCVRFILVQIICKQIRYGFLLKHAILKQHFKGRVQIFT